MKSITNRIIRSSRVRLASTYLAIIMVLSFGFSAIFYTQSVHEASINLSRQSVELKDYLYFATPDDLQNIQDGQLKLFKHSLVKRLVALNIGMLILGGCVSILLATRALRPLEDALESQSRFSSDAAHELRTPLTAMKTEIEVALRSKNLKLSEAKETLRSSLEEISKLEVLTSALLRLARDSHVVDKKDWQSYNLIDIFKVVLDRLSSEIKANKVQIDLPKSSLTAYGDPDQLVELFVTLISNAIKYSPKNTVIKVKISKHNDSFVKVDVIDKGIGIAEVDLPHIFERFYRADQSRNKTKIDGYGLGLSLAKSIVDSHGGSINVSSKYSKGTTFSVLLPS